MYISAIPIPPTTLVDHFESVMAPKNNAAATIFPLSDLPHGPLTKDESGLVDPFTVDELSHDVVSKINMDSAPGPDGVTPSLAKELFAFLPFFCRF